MAALLSRRTDGKCALLLCIALVYWTQAVVSFQTTTITTTTSSNRRISSFRSVSVPLRAINGERRKGDGAPSPVENTRANQNFIGLTTNGGKYVPDGLTPEQYEDIKTKEAEKIAKMDFAAWGPRFKRTAAPDGDWMVKPGLWIRGFQAGVTTNNGNAPLSEGEWERREARKRQFATLRSVATSFLFAYALLDILFLSSASIRSTSTSKRVITTIMAKNGILQALKQHVLASLVVSKVQILKVLLAAVATPSVLKYREIAQRRWLWSKRRQFGAPLLASVAFVATWSSVALRVAALR